MIARRQESEIEDISERQNLEAQLRPLTERYRALLDAVADVVFVVAMTGETFETEYVSPGVESFIGVPADEFRRHPGPRSLARLIEM